MPVPMVDIRRTPVFAALHFKSSVVKFATIAGAIFKLTVTTESQPAEDGRSITTVPLGRAAEKNWWHGIL